MIRKLKDVTKGTLKRLGVYTFLFEKVFLNRLVLKVLVCKWRYWRLRRAARRKPKGEKIRVLFIVSEIAKWKEQSLYELMEASGEFYPIVGLSAWNNQGAHRLTSDEFQKVQILAEQFFDSLGDRHVRTVTVENGVCVYHELSEFKPDIVFYTEQWGPCPRQHPWEVSRYALTCFLPYYVPDFGIIRIDCHQQVERLSDTYFCLGESWARTYRSAMRTISRAARYVVTGHPALDEFNRNQGRQPKENYVIYAPHFAYPHPKQLDFYLIGTFDWNGMQILEYAEAHPEIKWVFKPHPVLRRTLLETGVMTKDEIESYYNRWAKIAKVSTDSNYQELFLESRVMITDSGSFLPEYGSTGRPVIRLICARNRHIPPAAAKNVYDTYYNVNNIDEMFKTFKLVIENGQDPNRETRLEAVQKAGLCGVNASENIVKYIMELFGR